MLSHLLLIVTLLTHFTDILALKDSIICHGSYNQEIYHLNALFNLTFLGWYLVDILSHIFINAFWILVFNSFIIQGFISIKGKRADIQ